MNKNLNDLCVIGLGYIGLPTASLFAANGMQVIGVDTNKSIVETVNNGKIHIVEPDLSELVYDVVMEKKLFATTKPQIARNYIITVPTPVKKPDFIPDMQYVYEAVDEILPLLTVGNLIIIESTISVGTTEKVAQYIKSKREDLKVPTKATDEADIYIAHCPERVLPGKILTELQTNDRIIGGVTTACGLAAKRLYESFVKSKVTLASSPKVAEMCKLVENSYRDVNIAFANEISILADKAFIDVWELRRLANLHPRVNILEPGPGVGGHCIAVDPWFLVEFGKQDAELIKTARSVNDKKPSFVLDKVMTCVKAFKEQNNVLASSEISIAIYGLSYKADVDDLRESPAFKITKNIIEAHIGPIEIIEPNISDLPASIIRGHVKKVEYSNAVIKVVLVDHQEFKSIKFDSKFVVDTRGIQENK